MRVSYDTSTMVSLQVRALKAADSLVGRTLYRSLLSRARHRGRSGVVVPPPPPEDVRRVLVIRPGGIGDAVLFYPMLEALREAWPDAALEVLAESRNSGIFKANDRADRVWLYDRGGGRDLVSVIRGRYDVVVDTEQYHYLSAAIAYLTGAPVICGFDTRGRGGLFTHRVHYDDKAYEVFSFLDLARTVTGKEHSFDLQKPFFPIRQDLLKSARERYGIEKGGRWVVIQPGASIVQRRWEPEKFHAVAEWIVKAGWRTVLVGGETEREAARTIVEGLPRGKAINLCGAIPLAETAAVVGLCDLYVGSDTGILHIAYGVGTSTVHLFGPGVLEKWAPQGLRYQAISKKLPCSPCIRYNYVPPCPYDTECMKMITVDEVIEAISRVTAA